MPAARTPETDMPPLTLFADAVTTAPPAGGPAPGAGGGEPPQSPFTSMLFPIGLVALFFVVVILPANRRQKREAAAMMAGIKPGSKVFLSGGIVGSVVRVKDGDEEIVVRSEDSKFRVLRSSVVRVVEETSPETK